MNKLSYGLVKEMFPADRGEIKVSPDSTIGKLLSDAGKLTSKDVENVFRLHKGKNLRFGDAAVELGLVTRMDVQRALARQFGYDFLVPGEGGMSAELVAAYHPFTEQAEALRSLRSRLLLQWFKAGYKQLAIVGATAGTGCSFYTANLAVTFAQSGGRTLLIDANLRDPRQHRIFNIGNRAGLSELLNGRAWSSAFAAVSSFPNLSVLTSGAPPPNPSELLDRTAFVQLLGDLSASFDFILIDTAPAINCSDAQTVAAYASGALLVARRRYTRIKEITEIKEKLTSAGVVVVGAALNRY